MRQLLRRIIIVGDQYEWGNTQGIDVTVLWGHTQKKFTHDQLMLLQIQDSNKLVIGLPVHIYIHQPYIATLLATLWKSSHTLLY